MFLALSDRTTFYTLPSTCNKVPRLYDVSITENRVLFKQLISWLAARYRLMGSDGPTHILAIEARGCFIGAPLAVELGLPFVALRQDDPSPNAYVSSGDS